MRKIFVRLVLVALVVTLGVSSSLYSHLREHFSSAATSVSMYARTPYMETVSPTGQVPMRWSSCSDLTYATNFVDAPADASVNLAAALSALHRYTGFTFRHVGSTDLVPQANWTSTPLPADIVIAWVPISASTLLGRSGEISIGSVDTAAGHYLNGVVVMDSSATNQLPSGMASGDLGLLLLHELSHVMGLAHSHDPHSYMYPYFNVDTQSVTSVDAAHLANLHVAC